MELKNPLTKAILILSSSLNGFTNSKLAKEEVSNSFILPLKRGIQTWGLVILFFILTSSLSFAATKTWNVAGGGSWAVAGNWTGGLPLAGDDVVINLTVAGTISNVPSISLNSLSIGGTANAILTGTGPSTITINNTNLIVALNIAAGRTLTFGDGTAPNLLNLTLQAINTATTVAGTLTIAASSTIDCSTLLVSGTGTFIISAGATLVTANVAGITSAVGTLTGSIQTTGTRTFTTGANYIYNGSLAQATGTGLTVNTPANLTINNAAGVTLTAATTISGLLTMTSGTLSVGTFNLTVGSLTGSGNISPSGGARTLTVGSDNTSPAAYSGILGNGGGTLSLTKNGTGTLVLSGANLYTGLTTIAAGTLRAGVNSALANGAVTVNGGTYDLVTFTDAVGAVTLVSGSITGTTGILTGTSYSVQSGTISAILNGAVTMTKTTAGTVTLSGVNTYTGGTTLTSGTLNINNSQALGTVAGTFIINGGTIDNTSAAAITTLNYPQTWGGDFAFTGSQNLNLGTGAVAMSAARTVTTNGGILTVGGVISGGFRLTKSGAGALTLSGVNTFTGGTTLTAGTLNINNSQALGTVAGTFIINGGTIDNTSAAAITTLNYPQTWGGDFAFTGSQNLNLGTGAVTFSADRQVTVTANTLTAGGIISAPTFSLTKAGAGTLTMGASTVTLKGLSVLAGTLTAPSTTLNIAGDFNNGGTFTHNSGTVNFNGAALQSIGGATATPFNNITLSNSTAAVNANTNLSVAGTLTVNANAVLAPAAGVIVSGAAGTLTGSGTVQVTRTAATADFGSQYSIANKTLTNLTVDYVVLTGGQTITALSYGNLKLDNTSGTNSAAGVVNVSGLFSTAAGGTLSTFSNLNLNGTTGCGGIINA